MLGQRCWVANLCCSGINISLNVMLVDRNGFRHSAKTVGVMGSSMGNEYTDYLFILAKPSPEDMRVEINALWRQFALTSRENRSKTHYNTKYQGAKNT
ncbi:hypothetical protein RB195_009964 [Necator americanus]|uniref:Uncharacterized protein n=1 Tax=Necator americanus TaxID=51031 RepID=A0ABR1CVP7_NECAM